MNFEDFPLLVQWLIILLVGIPLLAVWSFWDLIKDKAKRKGQEAAGYVETEPLEGVFERTINKTLGIIVLLALIYIFGEPTAERILKVSGIAITLFAVFGFMKKVVSGSETEQPNMQLEEQSGEQLSSSAVENQPELASGNRLGINPTEKRGKKGGTGSRAPHPVRKAKTKRK